MGISTTARTFTFTRHWREGCDEKYDAIVKFTNSKEKHFDCWFDNITIVMEVSREKGFLESKVHKKQMFGSSS